MVIKTKGGWFWWVIVAIFVLIVIKDIIEWLFK